MDREGAQEMAEVDCLGIEERSEDNESFVRDRPSCVDRYCAWFQLLPS